MPRTGLIFFLAAVPDEGFKLIRNVLEMIYKAVRNYAMFSVKMQHAAFWEILGVAFKIAHLAFSWPKKALPTAFQANLGPTSPLVGDENSHRRENNSS